VRFTLEVDLDALADDADVVAELQRILRYWGGNLHHYDLRPGTGEDVSDSAYTAVGRWQIT
jgi:hypothetical protein